MHRGLAGQLERPMGSTARSYRAVPRRAAPANFLMRRSGVAALSPETKHRVTALGNGLYRVVSTVTVERTLTEAELRKLGISIPAPEMPWEPEKPEPPHARIPRPTDGRQPTSDFGRAMAWWREHFKGFDRRLPTLVPQALDEFGLARLLLAFEEIRTHHSDEPKYDRLKAILRRWRDEEEKGAGQ